MSEYMKFPATALVHKVPKTLRADQAVFCEPLACSVHAVERGGIKEGDVVAVSGTRLLCNSTHCSRSVSGCGPLGLGCVAAIKRFTKAKTVVAIDLSASRLDIAKQCGADLVLSPTEVSLAFAFNDD